MKKGKVEYLQMLQEPIKRMSTTSARAHDTPFSTSTYVYNHIKENITYWIEEAIDSHNNYPQ